MLGGEGKGVDGGAGGGRDGTGEVAPGLSEGPSSEKRVRGEEAMGTVDEEGKNYGTNSSVMVKKSQSVIPFSQLEQVNPLPTIRNS